MCGSSNNAQQQNAAANNQIANNTATAQKNLSTWLAANPSILAQAPQSITGPQQLTGSTGGGVAGISPTGVRSPGNNLAFQGFNPQGGANMPRVMPQGAPPQTTPSPGAQRQPQPQAQFPPGLLSLMGGKTA